MIATAEEIGQELRVLINSMPLQKGLDERSALVAFAVALNGFTLEEIHRGVCAFIRGEVEGTDISLKYCPTPPQLASLIRKVNAYSLAKREREMREAREAKQIAGPKFEPPSDEAKARMQARYEEFCRDHEEKRRQSRLNSQEIFERSNIRWDNCKYIQNPGEAPTPEMKRAQELAKGPLPPKVPVREKYGITDDKLAAIPDAPNHGLEKGMSQVGDAVPIITKPQKEDDLPW